MSMKVAYAYLRYALGTFLPDETLDLSDGTSY